MSLVDQIRQATVGAQIVIEERLVDVNGVQVKVVPTTVGNRSKIQKKAVTGYDKNGEPEIDSALFQCLLVIECTVCPESGNKIFTEADIPVFLKQPTGGWFDRLAEGIVASASASVEEAEGN